MEACRDSKGISTIRNNSRGWGGRLAWPWGVAAQTYMAISIRPGRRGEDAARRGNPETTIFRFLVKSIQRTPERLWKIARGRYGSAATFFTIPFDFSFHKPKLIPYFMAVSREGVQRRGGTSGQRGRIKSSSVFGENVHKLRFLFLF